MKKVLFLQNEGNNYGGVVQVNRLVGEELLNHNFNVSIISIRNTKNAQKNDIKTKINEIIINEKETWGTYQGREILKEIKQIHLFKGFKMVCSRIKYKISIKKAIECEYFEEYHWLYNEFREKHKVDYLILGVHFFPYNGEWTYVGGIKLTPEILEVYTDYVIKSMESGYFDCLAHPDLFGVRYRNWDEYTIEASKRILEAAERLNMPIEVNINGFKRGKVKYNLGERYFYPIEEFWNLSKEFKVKRILGVDAHFPEDLRNRYMGEEFAEKLNLELIDKL